MEEEIVREKVRDWLGSKHTLASVVTPGPDVVAGDLHIDPERPTFHWTNEMRVECKGTDADVDKAIGQTLRYFCEKPDEPICLAVPEDYKRLKELQRITSIPNLPIGLLIVRYNGEIQVLKKPEIKAVE